MNSHHYQGLGVVGIALAVVVVGGFGVVALISFLEERSGRGSIGATSSRVEEPAPITAPIPTETSLEDAVVQTWNQYVSAYGIRVAYPPSWRIRMEVDAATAPYPLRNGLLLSVSFSDVDDLNPNNDGELFLVVYDTSVTSLEKLIASMTPQSARGESGMTRTPITLSDGTSALSVTGVTPHPRGDIVFKAVFIAPSPDRVIMLHNGGGPTEYFEQFVESATLTPPGGASADAMSSLLE